MSQADELLNSLSEEDISTYTANPETEPHIVIGKDRKITVPEELKRIAVQNDHNIETVTFDCPRYWDNHDFSTMKLYVNYMRYDGYKGRYPVDNVRIDTEDPSVIHFEWTISRNLSIVVGSIKFLVCAKEATLEGEEVTHWNTDLNSDMYVTEGLEVENVEVESDPDSITALLLRMDKVEEMVNSATDIMYAVETYNGMQEKIDRVNARLDEAMSGSYTTNEEDHIHENIPTEAMDLHGVPEGLVVEGKFSSNGTKALLTITKLVVPWEMLRSGRVTVAWFDGYDTRFKPISDIELLVPTPSGDFVLYVTYNEGPEQVEVQVDADDPINYFSSMETPTITVSYPLAIASIPELNDIRVGADGTRYGSAGEAVRKQFNKLNTLIDGLSEGDVNRDTRLGAMEKTVDDIRREVGVNGAHGKSAYEYALDAGYNGTEEEFAEDMLPDNISADAAEIVKAQVPLVKSAEQPTFVNSIDEMTDTSKVYVMPDGYMYGYKELENYNLLKPSKVSYSTRLQDDIEGTTTSTPQNAVTDWIPVEYGKYYTMSTLVNDARSVSRAAYQRMNLKRADGTIIVYNKGAVPVVSAGGKQKTINIEYEDAVAIMLHFAIVDSGGTNVEIGTAETLKAHKPMLVEGDSAEQSYSNAVSLEYVDGDAESPAEWYNTGLAYNQPVDYEDRVRAMEEDVAELQEDMKELEDSMTNPASASPYFRDVNFGVLPFTYYHGLANNYDSQGFVKNTKYADFIAKWKALVADHSGYVTEADHATASDGQEIYMYDFKPARIDNQDKPIPKILIVAGQHGFEKSNVYGLYHFVDNLLNRWTQHPSLEYIRNNVELLIVPVLNTYGFDNLEYKNKNGVNTNRNYDSGWVLEANATSPQYGGAAPFDQPETQFVRKVLANNPKTLLVIDFHTCGGISVENYHDVNWCGICYNNDSYYNRMKDSIAHHLSAITGRFNVDYELNQPNVMMGHMTTTNGNGLLRGWATDNNFIGVLVEGFNGFPNDTDFVGKIYKANEEILVNYLITAMNYLGK